MAKIKKVQGSYHAAQPRSPCFGGSGSTLNLINLANRVLFRERLHIMLIYSWPLIYNVEEILFDQLGVIPLSLMEAG